MCGICGVVRRGEVPVEEKLLRSMADAIAHRGPDGEGFRVGPGWGLGHRRLAVIDLATGDQPLSNEDGTVWVVFNGEIYNYRDLRARLEGRGHVFRTNSDTEVLVHLYEEKGEAMCSLLEGMFAFAIWDAKAKRLLLARDRAGEKPLYFYRRGGEFAFASEMKALLPLPSFERRVRPEAIDEYLTYQFVPGPDTIWEGVERIQPGEWLSYETARDVTRGRYFSWDLRTKTRKAEPEAQSEFRGLLADATAGRMISDVPLGAFLSGGIDSSSVVWAMSEAVKNGRATGPVRTFAIGFPEADFTETAYAEAIAKRFGTTHETFVVEPKALDLLPKIAWHYDQPYADSSAIPTFALCEVTRRRVTVALTGDAGDELFGGYDRYRAVRMHRALTSLVPVTLRRAAAAAGRFIPEGANRRSFPRRVRRFLEAQAGGYADLNLALFRYFSEEEKADLYAPDFAERVSRTYAPGVLLDRLAGAPADEPLDRVLYGDLTLYLPDDLLVKVDVAAMAYGLETRAPLLDARILAFAASLPAEWKVGWRTSKKFFREAMRGILPDDILAREKMGFGVPIPHWFRGPLLPFLRERLLSDETARLGLFRREALARLVDDHAEGRRNHANRLWALLALTEWYRAYAPTA